MFKQIQQKTFAQTAIADLERIDFEIIENKFEHAGYGREFRARFASIPGKAATRFCDIFEISSAMRSNCCARIVRSSSLSSVLLIKRASDRIVPALPYAILTDPGFGQYSFKTFLTC